MLGQTKREHVWDKDAYMRKRQTPKTGLLTEENIGTAGKGGVTSSRDALMGRNIKDLRENSALVAQN